ncbi:MAG: hypothetical protein FGM62_04800 [Methylobacterium sp.]|nr:hypothetical protein [Methylobacterium sp.]
MRAVESVNGFSNTAGSPALPACVRFHGDDELHFIGTQDAWQQDVQLSRGQIHPDDRLIDADGHLYTLERDAEGHLGCRRAPGRLSLQEVLQLVRRHAAQDGACCVAKLSAASIAEAISMLA